MSFRALHVPGTPLVMPNPWDVGSARMLEGLGFSALASTSAGAAFAVGKTDGSLSLEEMLSAASAIKQAVSVPVSADLENGGGDAPEAAAHAMARAIEVGLDGASLEDLGNDGEIYPRALTMERAQAALEARKGSDLVVTVRTEIMLSENKDFDEALHRISSFAAVGADVIFAPGLSTRDQIRDVISAADGIPVNVLIANNSTGLTVSDLAELGVARISVGSGFARVAYGAMLAMARQMQDGEITYPDATASFADIDDLLK